MNGYLLDTNSVIYFFDGEEKISAFIKSNKSPLYISFITQIEILCFETQDEALMNNIVKFTESIDIITTNEDIITAAIEYRKKLKLKIPDAIIAATAKVNELTLITADKAMLTKINNIKMITPL